MGHWSLEFTGWKSTSVFPRLIVSPNPLPSLSVAVTSLPLLRTGICVFSSQISTLRTYADRPTLNFVAIRHLVSVDSTKILVCAFVLSRLDYCNSLLSGHPKHILDKLQKVQNSAARLVLKARKRDHVLPLLKTLHWLPIQTRIEYKMSTLCHSFFSETAPVYFSDLLHVYSPSRQLRSLSDSRTLRIPHVRTKTFGNRSFSYAAPSAWNSLPREIRYIQSTTAFKTALKTHLFQSYYH